MSNFDKINGLIDTDIASVDGVAREQIHSFDGAAIVGGSASPTVAVVTSAKGWVMLSTTEGFESGSWSAYQANGRTADTQRNVDYGLLSGSGIWIAAVNKTARPIRLSTAAAPTLGDWTEVGVTGEAGYDVTHGIEGTFVLVGNDAEYATFQGKPGEAITTGGNWDGSRPINGDLATSKILTGVGFNHSTESPLYVAVSNTGRVFSSPNGGNGSVGDWTTRYGTAGTSGNNNDEAEALWEVAYGNDKWVATGYYDKMEHITGSGDATSWGLLNKPAGGYEGAFYGVDSDGANNWVMAGASGYVWYSTDNAATWTETRVAMTGSTYGTWQCVKYDGAGTWWLVGGAGYLAKSSDMISWTVIVTPVTDVGGATSLGIAFNTVRSS